MTGSKQDEVVRSFFDEDSRRYWQERYPERVRTCGEFSYLARKIHAFRMLSRVPRGKGRLLDLGCGPGVYTRDLLGLGWNVVDVDLSSQMVRTAKSVASDAPRASQADFAVSHAACLPFDSGVFDCVLCIGVISYIENLQQALSEISRVLRPSGAAIFQISNRGSLYELWVRMKRGMRRRSGSGDRPSLESQIRYRPYWPKTFREACLGARLQAYDDRYYDFHVPVLAGHLPGPSLWAARRLEYLSDTRAWAWLGASYLVAVRRLGPPAG